jgi:anti-sigma B factor antagonist
MENKANVEITLEDKTAIVVFKSASISYTEDIAVISKQIKEFIDNNHPKRVIFDFGEVKFFSSQVLGLLLEIRAKLLPQNGKVAISKINPQLHRVFKITNLDKVFSFFPDTQNAIKAMSIE